MQCWILSRTHSKQLRAVANESPLLPKSAASDRTAGSCQSITSVASRKSLAFAKVRIVGHTDYDLIAEPVS